MEIVIGIVLYILVIAGFMAFGKFLKEADQRMEEMTPNKKEAEDTERNLFI